MPLPGGLSGGQATRLGNITAQAAKASMGGNIAAVNALNPQVPGKHVAPKSQVSGYQDSAGAVPPSFPPQPQQSNLGQPQATQNTGAPSAPMPQAVDPIQEYNTKQAVEKIVSSPQMMDTVTRLKLRNHFKGRSDDGIGTEAFSMIHH